MKIKHSFVSLLDLAEALPFTVSPAEKEPKDKELFEFVDQLAQEFGEEIYYMGNDIIEDKFYERFLFEHGGFLEVMVQAPVAIVAHFVDRARAFKFARALKRVILSIDKPEARILADSIEVSSEHEYALDYQTWSKLKKVREAL